MPLEINGQALQATGRIAEVYDDGTALAEFGVPGGGALGVRVKPGAPVKVGDPFVIQATVTAADEHTVGVTVVNFAGDVQGIPLDRSKVPVAAVVGPPI